MEIKTRLTLKESRGEGDKKREYIFMADAGVPLGEAYDVCHEFLNEIVKLATQASERAKQNKKEDEKEAE